MDVVLDFIKIAVPASLVVYAMYLAIKAMVAKQIVAKELDLKLKSLELTLPVRMQAFERMALFLERISPGNMLVRLDQTGMNAQVLHFTILEEIRKEFNHNVAQQVYIDKTTWEKIVNAKEDFVTKVNATFQEVNPEDDSVEYSKKLLQNSMNSDKSLIDLALDSLKDEMSKYYSV